jgi:group I intron endonuclease
MPLPTKKANTSGIYLFKNDINGLVYVGSSNKINHRKNQHISALRLKKHSNKKFQNAYDKYGEENFSFSILEECPKEILIEREQFWIDFYESFKPKKGYNLNSKAERGVFSEESKRKISENHKRYWKGKTFSIEHRNKMSKNNSKFWKGLKLNESHKRKLSNSHKKKILQIDKNGEVVNEFFGIKEASLKTGFSEIGIQQVLTKYKRKTIYGFDFQYKN